jgi:hypothetical protein
VKKNIFQRVAAVFVLVITTLIAHGQKGELVNAVPEGGSQKLLLHFYKTDFTPEQRMSLSGVVLELIFEVESDGTAILEKVNGTTDISIIDRIFATASTLPRFEPARRGGIAEPSIYITQIAFAPYPDADPYYHSGTDLRYRQPASRNDFEMLETGTRMDILFGILINQFDGVANEYMKTGGGMKVDIMFTGKRKTGAGLTMGLYINGSKKDFPVYTVYQQDQERSTILIGPAIGRIMREWPGQELYVQLEACYALLGVVSSENTYDNDYLNFNGFSPGFVVNYIVNVGRERFITHYGTPSLSRNSVSFHAAIRPLFYERREASGVMVEFGIAWRLQMYRVQAYRLRDGL